MIDPVSLSAENQARAWLDELDREREVRAAVGGGQPRAALPPDRLGRPLRARGLPRPGARHQGRLGRGRAGRRRALAARARAAAGEHPGRRQAARCGGRRDRSRGAAPAGAPGRAAGRARDRCCCARSSRCARGWTSTRAASRTRRSSWSAPTRPRCAELRAEDAPGPRAPHRRAREAAARASPRRRARRSRDGRRGDPMQETLDARARAPGGGAPRAHGHWV